MPKITFKATKKSSITCSEYRQIEKKGDLEYDIQADSDDVIILPKRILTDRIIIDCDKKTGVFSLKF